MPLSISSRRRFRFARSNSSLRQLLQVSRRIGKFVVFKTASRSFFDLNLLSHRGILFLNPILGRRSARPAFSRNRAPKSPVVSSLFLRYSSTLSALTRSRIWLGSKVWGKRRRMASSSAKVSRGYPYSSSQAADRARAKGRLIRPPQSVWRITCLLSE